MGAAASASRRARDDALRARAEAARPGSLSVSVRDLSGAAHAIRAEPSDSIESVRRKVEAASGHSWRRQRLYAVDGGGRRRRAVKDGTLAENGIGDGGDGPGTRELHLVVVSEADARARERADTAENRAKLVAAATHGHAELARALVRKGVDVDGLAPDGGAGSRGPDRDAGSTPLIWAAKQGHLEVARALLAAGAEVERPNRNGKTALWWAAAEGRDELVSLLLDAGADADCRSRGGDAALWWLSLIHI